MNFELIVACDSLYSIGKNGILPWYLPEDLIHFREKTNNHILVMGRKTFDSLPTGPLKNRIHIVISRSPSKYECHDDSVLFTNMENSISTVTKIQKHTGKKVFVIGGADIYRLFLDYCNIIHLTRIHCDSGGDVFFPSDTLNSYVQTNKTPIFRSKHQDIPYQFFTYTRNFSSDL